MFSTIQGNALTSTNGALANAFVRLRDARVGQIVETQVTDQSGLFAFPAVDPGSYIVEIMGQDQYSVLAASQMLNVGPGEAVSAIVKLPFKIPPFAGVLGQLDVVGRRRRCRRRPRRESWRRRLPAPRPVTTCSSPYTR